MPPDQAFVTVDLRQEVDFYIRLIDRDGETYLRVRSAGGPGVGITGFLSRLVIEARGVSARLWKDREHSHQARGRERARQLAFKDWLSSQGIHVGEGVL